MFLILKLNNFRGDLKDISAITTTLTVIRLRRLSPNEEIAYGPAAWLWDYLRRSGATGFLLPLSGGADSSATAAIVGSMCEMVYKAAATDKQVLLDMERLTSPTLALF